MSRPGTSLPTPEAGEQAAPPSLLSHSSCLPTGLETDPEVIRGGDVGFKLKQAAEHPNLAIIEDDIVPLCAKLCAAVSSDDLRVSALTIVSVSWSCDRSGS